MTRNLFHTTVPPMPDTRCPAWCRADHGSAWLQQVEACRGPFADGELRDPAGYFEPLHSLTLHRGGPAVTLDLQRGVDEDVVLHLHADDVITPAQARALAAALLQAADRLEAVQPAR